MHFQQFEDLEFLILFRRSMLPESSDPHKTALQSVQAFRIRRGLSRFYFIRIRISTRLQSGHEYLDFE